MTDRQRPTTAAAAATAAGRRPGSRPAGLSWIVGIENAYIPDMGVDELAWTRHRERWREDLLLAKSVGATMIRYGITWPELEPMPGQYDWRWCDEVVDELQRLGVEPIWDLVHFGVPAWLPGGFLDPGFPAAFARFCAAFARRYRGSVDRITPLNEPYISTYFRAGWGIWPPHLKGLDGFVTMLRPIVAALRGAIREIRAGNPGAEIWLNDGADTFHTSDPRLRERARELTLMRYAAFDLLLGVSGEGDEVSRLLLRGGLPESELSQEPVEIDVIGLDYYPDTEHDIAVDPAGELMVTGAASPNGVAHTLLEYHRRYGRPLFIAESSHSGPEPERQEWIRFNLSEIETARAQGADVLGYTWWPLFDHIDWNTLLRERNGFVCNAGLFHLTPTVADRLETATAHEFRRLATGAAVPPVAPVEGRSEGGKSGR